MSEQPTGVRGGDGKAGRPLGVHELERELEDTRQEMRGTIEALFSEKLSSEALMRQARDAFGGPAEFADNLGAAMRRNPVPATLAAVGLAWLFWSDRHPARAGEGIGTAGEQTRESMKERAAAGRERLHDVAEGMRSRRENLADSARLTGIRANRMMNDAGDYGRRVFDEQPFLVGALGLAIGALVGAALPRTATEERALGPARERLAEAAEKRGAAAVEKASEQAESGLEKGAAAARGKMAEQAPRAEEETPPGGDTSSLH